MFRTLPAEVNVRLAIWITHHGDDLRLGWVLDGVMSLPLLRLVRRSTSMSMRTPRHDEPV
jgi:hypothetical protein